jgi:hypothetical protein
MPIKIGQEENVDLPVSPDAPPEQMPLSLEAMSEQEREAFKKKLQSTPRSEIDGLPEETFKQRIAWIMDYMSWMYRASDHKIIFAICNKDFPEWFEIFIERYGVIF